MKTKIIKEQTIHIYKNIEEIPDEIKVVAAYQRKTNKENESASINAQKSGAEYFCAKNKQQHLIHFTEPKNISGEITDRPALNNLISAIKEKKISIVLVRDLDRLFRAPKIFSYIKKFLIKYDVELFTFNGNTNFRSPIGEFNANLSASVGRFEVAICSSRIRNSRRTDAEQGFTPYGIAPYGYISQSMLKKQLILEGVDKDDAAIEATKIIKNKKIYQINEQEKNNRYNI